jgi:hypothetical protein
MGRTLKQAKEMQQDGGQATTEADRGSDAATTNEKDMDRPYEEASSASDDMRVDEVPRDSREQTDRQMEERDERAGDTKAAGGADERRRDTNNLEDANMQASRAGGQP